MQNAVRLSNRQYALIQEIDADGGMTLDRLLRVSQVTAGGTVRRGWFKWNQEKALFMLTKEGRFVLDAFYETNIDRKANNRGPLSSFIPALRKTRTAKA